MTSVFIVEDDPITRAALVARIDAHPHLHVGTAVGSCAEILSAVAAHTPDVLLVDLGLPDGDGLSVIAAVSASRPTVNIMVITVFGDERRVVSAIKAGAAGYLLKDDSSHDIGQAVEQLIAGGSPISAAIARHLIEHFRPERPHAAPAAEGQVKLSERERELLSLASKGYNYREIARMLNITANTVSSYTKRIYEKLAVSSRGEALFEATRLGLIGGNSP